MTIRFFRIIAVSMVTVSCSLPAVAQTKAVTNTQDYNHDKFETLPRDIYRDFGGFIVSFDSDDDDDGDGTPDLWAIPHWVAHEIKRYDFAADKGCLPTGSRPGKWFVEPGLFNRRIAPSDASYATSSGWRNNHPNWFDRGHLAMKFLLERIKERVEPVAPENATEPPAESQLHSPSAWNSHTTLNAVPQRHKFNARIWKDLEDLTGAWAQEFGAVWIITGPIILDAAPATFIGDPGEVPVAIPDALFKIVARVSQATTIDEQSHAPEVLAFLYPQIAPGYDAGAGNYPHANFLVSIDRIEELTGLDFFTNLSAEEQAILEASKAPKVWNPPEKQNFLKACSRNG